MNVAEEFFEEPLQGRDSPQANPPIDRRGSRSSLAQTLFESAPIPCVIADAECRIRHINPAFSRLLGYSFGEINGAPVEAITHADDRALTHTRNHEILSGVQYHAYRKRYRHKDGHVVDAEVTVSGLTIGGRRFMLGQIRDLSDLMASRERLELAADNAGIGIWEANLRTMAMCWDAKLRLLYELEPAAPDPNIPEWLAMVVAEDRPAVESKVGRCVAVNGEDAFDAEFRIALRSGERRWLRSTGRVHRDGSGNAIRGIGINIDISHQKALAEERLQHADRLRQSLEHTIQAITTALEMRDPYTAGHQCRVAELAVSIARQMGLSDERVAAIKLAAEVHDIGKIGIPAEILSKPGRLSEAQYNLIKTHAQAGYEILKGIEFPWPIAEIVYQHHEQIDGSGYPRGLKGDEILLEARIIAVADTLEAMGSHRPYRPARGLREALAELVEKRGTSYDPAVVDACQALFAR